MRKVLSFVAATVLVFALSPVFGSAAVERVLVHEGFEGATFPPTGFVANGPWQRESPCLVLPSSGTACAALTYDPNVFNHSLELPVVPLTGATSPTLSFDLFVNDPDGAATLQLQAGNGSGWDGFRTARAAAPGSATTHVSLDLTGAFGDHFRLVLTQVFGSAPASLKIDNIAVSKANHAPTANAVARSVNEDAQVAVPLSGADSDSDPLTFTVDTPPAHGTLTGTGATRTYKPAANFNGTDTFTYVASDGLEDSAPATATITVVAINDAPSVTAPAKRVIPPNGFAYFHTSDGTGVTIADPDAGTGDVQVSLSSLGEITLAGTTGLALTAGDGTKDHTIRFTSTVAAANAAFQGMTVYPDPTAVTTHFTIGVDDLANGGLPALVTEKTVDIVVDAAAGSIADALVGATPTLSTATGNDVHGVPQTLTLPSASPGDSATAYVFLQNDGAGYDQFTITGGAGGSGLGVTYLTGTTDVTSAVAAGALIRSIGSGGTLVLTVQLDVADGAAATTRTIDVSVRAGTSGTTDAVSIVLPLSAAPAPDLAIYTGRADDAIADLGSGIGVVDPAGTHEGVRDVGEIGGAATSYTLWLENNGAAGTVRLRGVRPPTGYTVRLVEEDFHDNAIADVTVAVLNGTADLVMPAGGVKRFRLTSAVGSAVAPFTVGSFSLTVSSGGVTRDKVSLETTAASYQPKLTLVTGTLANKEVAVGDPVEFPVDVASDLVGVPFAMAQDIALKGTPGGNGFSVRYFDASYDVTESVVAGSYTTYLYPPGACAHLSCRESKRLRIVITALHAAATGATMPVSLVASSTLSTKTPHAHADVAVSAHLSIRVDVGTGDVGSPVGIGTSGDDAAAQTATVLTQQGLTSNFVVRVKNNGIYPTAANLHGTALGDMVMTLYAGSSDITSQLLGAGFTTPTILPGATYDVQVRLRPDDSAPDTAKHALTVVAVPTLRSASSGDTARLAAVIGGSQCQTTSVEFDMIRATGTCIQPNDKGWLSRAPITVNGIEFSFPNNGSGTLVRSENYVVGAFAPIPVPWMRSANAVVSVGGAPLYHGPLNLRLGGPGSATLDITEYGSRMENGMRPTYGGTFLLHFSADTPGLATVELNLTPPPLFNAVPQTVTLNTSSSNADGGARQVMTWPALQVGTFGLAAVTTIYDPDAKEWIGYGRMGFPKAAVSPNLRALVKFTLTPAGSPVVTFFFLRLGLGSAAVPVAPEVELDSIEAAVSQRPLSVYGKASFAVLPTEKLGIANLSKIAENVFDVDGAFAYEDTGSKLTITGDVTLFKLFKLFQGQVTVVPDGMRATGKWTYSVNMGPLGTVGLDVGLDGAIGTSGFQVEGSGTAHLGGTDGTVSVIMSSKGVAGCASVGGIGGGAGLTWGGSFSGMYGSCSLADWRVVDIPHIDTGAITDAIDKQLTDADFIAGLIDALPANLRSQLP